MTLVSFARSIRATVEAALHSIRPDRPTIALLALSVVAWVACAHLLSPLDNALAAAQPLIPADGLRERALHLDAIADSLRLLGSADSALVATEALLDEARAAEDELSVLAGLITRGKMQDALGRFAAAESTLVEATLLAEAMTDSLRLTIALLRLGDAVEAQDRLEEAHGLFARCAELSRQIGSPVTEAQALSKLAAVDDALGDPAAAAARLRAAYALERSIGRMRSAILIALRIGRTETRLGRHDEAAAILDEALAASREHRFDDGVCAALVNLGFLSTAEGRVAEGAGHLRRAAAFARRQGLPEEEMRALLELSRSLATTEGPGPALTLVDRQAARLRERVGIRWQLELDSRRGALLEALVRHEEALKLIQDTDREAKAAGLLRLRLDTLPNGADCYLALGRADSALDWFEQAAAVWEAERELPPEPEWREERGSRGRRIYTALASLLLGPPPGPYSNDRVGEAFDALQRFKALTLRERMLGPAFDRAGAPGEDRSDGNASIINLARLQEEVLHDGELLIDVCLGPEISLLFAVTGETCRAVRLAGEEAGLRKRLKLLHARFSAVPEAGAAVDEAAHDQVCGQLSQLLFGEISDLVAGCDRILFVPDGLLTLVPTGALYGSPGATGSPQRLIFDKETARVPSASILADVRRGGAVHRSAERGVLAVGTGGGRLAGRGPAAPAEEIEWLASRYEEVDTRVSDGAGPPRLTGDDLTHYDVLHIAAPTEWDDRHPWRSGILISSRTTTEDEEDEAAPPAAARATPGGGGMPEAGAATLLRASSIASLDLHARLAALTGCEPAASRILSGEGALALPSAFMNAGVLAIVACLWPVDALATERAMMSFYEHLAGGATAAAALREAKLALLADSRFQEPHYWAGLVLVGDGATRIDLVEQPRPQSALRWTILLLLAVLLMAWIWSRRSATSRGRAGQAG